MLSHGRLDFVGITQGQTTFSHAIYPERERKRGLSLSYPHEYDEKSGSKQSLRK